LHAARSRLACAWAIAAAACVADSSPWALRRAEQHHARGDLDSALHVTDREIVASNRTASPQLIALHVSLLRELGRTAEADAFLAFAQRYAAGEDTLQLDAETQRRDCTERQAGYDLIDRWGEPDLGPWSSETIVATFEIAERGEIQNIAVRSAMDPGAAWLAIDVIGRAEVRRSRLIERQREAPASFPVSLCLWRNLDPLAAEMPRDGRIRGSR
jgi:hypothetical protein